MTFFFNILLLGFAALLFTLASEKQLNASQLQLSNLAFFNTASTLALYLIMRSRMVYVHPGESAPSINRKSYAALITLLLLIAAWFFFHLPLGKQLLVVPATALAAAYFLPVMNKKRLRDFFYIKHLVVGATWAIATVAFAAESYAHTKFALLFFERLFFVASLSLLFDHRDLAIDEQENHLTIARHKGWNFSKQLSVLLMLCAICFAVLLSQNFLKPAVMVFTLGLIFATRKNNSTLWYNVVMEAMMIAYAVASLV